MSADPSSMQSLFAELKRRRVFKVMAVYGAVAFVVLQVADLAFEPLGLPDWTMTFMLFLSLLGFPIAVVLAWAFETTPEGVKRTAPAAPEEIQDIVNAPRSHRWSAGLLALASMGLLFATGWWMGGGGRAGDADGSRLVSTAEAADLKAIAALPFENVNGTEENQWIAVGIHDDLITQLSRIGALRVTSRTSVREYGSTEKSLKDIARELGVEYILEGSVRTSGTKARVNVSLVDAGADEQLWSEQYDVDVSPDSLFDVQSRISRSVAGKLEAQLTAEDEKTLDAIQPASSSVAQQWYYRGIEAWWRENETTAEAVAAMRRAIELDSGYVAAWSKLAKYESRLVFLGQNDDAAARAATERTERLAPGTLEAHLARGYYEYYGRQNYDAALSAFRAAEHAAPSDADVAEALGLILRRQGEWEASTAALKRAVELDPRNASRLQFLAENLSFQGAFRVADVVFDRSLSVDPGRPATRGLKVTNLVALDRSTDRARRLADELRLDPDHLEEGAALTYLAFLDRDYARAAALLNEADASEMLLFQGVRLFWRSQALYLLDPDAAAPVAESALTVMDSMAGNDTLWTGGRAQMLVMKNRREEALQSLESGARRIRAWHDHVDATRQGLDVAVGYAMLGDFDAAFEMLDDLVGRPSVTLTVAGLRLEPRFDALRDDPRFDRLIERREEFEAEAAKMGEAGRPWLP